MAKPHLFDSIERKQVFSNEATIIKDKLVEKFLSFKDRGNLIYFDKEDYPYAYLDEYNNAIKEKALMVKNNIIFGVHNASYVEYDLLDGNKRFYLQNICWWNDEPANISICIGTATHKVLIEDYEIKSLFVTRDNKVAIYQKDNNTELLLVNNTGIIKGYGIADLVIYTESACTNLKISVEGEKIFNIADLL